MKTSRLIILLFCLLAVVVGAVLQFFRSETDEIATLTETTQLLLQVKQQDIELNEEALKAASFKLVHFDGIVDHVKALSQSRKELAHKILSIPDVTTPSLTGQLDRLNTAINKRITILERLKGKVALARNSSNFLLLALRDQVSKQGLSSSALALRTLNEMQGYQLFPTPERLKTALSHLKLLGQQKIHNISDSKFSIILRHMAVGLQATQDIAALQKQMFIPDSQMAAEQMIASLHKLQNLKQTQSNNNLLLLSTVIVAIFIVLSYALIRWSQARAKSNRTSQLFKEAVESMPEGFAFFGPDEKLAFWNSTFARLYKSIGTPLATGMSLANFKQIQKNSSFIVHREQQDDGSYIEQTVDNRWILSSNTPMAQGGHSLVRIDLTAQRKAQEQLHLAATVFQTASEAMMVTNKNDIIQMVNPAFTKITGYSETDVIGAKPSILSSGRHTPGYYEEMFNNLRQYGTWQGEIWNRRKNGEIYPEWLSITTIYDEEGEVLQRVSLFNDITSRKKSEERIHYQANYDSLTDLPNRNLFKDRLTQSINLAERHNQRVAILFLDIDNFKHINDTLGHLMGDELLRHVAERLRSLFRTSDTIARLSGDEFIIILNDADENADIEALLERVLECLSLPYVLDGNTTYTSVSIGTTFYPDDAKNVDGLLQNADAAMFKAKDLGRNTYCFFTPEMNSRAQERHTIEVAMHKALEDEDFILHYQPMVDPVTQKVVSTEALIRWKDPERGLIPPNKFIPVAEDNGLIIPLGEWILRKACSDCAKWNTEKNLPINVSINLSSRQFQRSDILGLVRETLAQTGLAPEKLTLEITESLLVDDDNAVLKTLKDIRDLGVLLSIDDFGTGYSSLSYLKKFPITTLKIDRSFIIDVLNDPEDAALTQAILSMAQSLNLKVVAEGVETEDQVAYLSERNCDLIQGYYFSKPLELDDLLAAFASKKLTF